MLKNLTIMRKLSIICAALALVSSLVSCKEDVENSTIVAGIVPAPQYVEVADGTFKVKGADVNLMAVNETRTREMLASFAEKLSAVTGRNSRVSDSEDGFIFKSDDDVPVEGYEIKISEDIVEVRASDYNGFFYAVQTLRQMLPVEVYGGKRAPGVNWELPCCVISDSPRFGYRGVMIDECRHFFGKDEIIKVLDVMSLYKLNRLHWHLTEDQGWRIEIKSYPRLTEVGAWRAGTQIGKDWESCDSIPYGGFYTQEEIKEVVKYAEGLGITIIPEVDLPGHMVAALAAYPEFGCTGGPYSVRTKWGIADEALCPGKEATFKFLEGVLGEVADLFPSEYFNIGGDECRKGEWEKCPDCQALIKKLGLKSDAEASKEQRLQNYVTSRVQNFLATKGKKIIGWDEILEGELAEGATVMSWRGSKGGIKAANMGYDVVMAPNDYCYLDYAQSPDLENEPLCITSDPKRAVPIEKLYSLDPFDGIPEDSQFHVLGVQGNLWTEYIPTNEQLEYMLLPRMLALSEVQWCSPDIRDFDRFITATKEHQYRILESLGYNFRR